MSRQRYNYSKKAKIVNDPYFKDFYLHLAKVVDLVLTGVITVLQKAKKPRSSLHG